MRISTAGLHNSALAGILDRNADLVKTQSQIASGKRIQTPADDPAGAVSALDLDRVLAESQQYSRNSDALNNRLSLEDQTLSDVTNLLQRVRELAVQANSATNDQTARQAIVAELKVRMGELVDVANTRDSNGDYLFSGYSAQTQPFAQSASGVVYSGDQGVRQLQTSPTQRIADSNSGSEVFMNIINGNGTFTTAAAGTNTGGGMIDGGSVTDPTAWVRDTYTVTFTSATTWQVTNSASTVVASGNYISSGAIAFNGAQVSVSGTPATGDTFTIAPSAAQDMFSTVSGLLTTLASATTTDAQRAQFATQMGTALSQLDQALDHVSGIRAQVGARLSLLDDTKNSRDDNEVQLQQSISQLRDLDFASAITKLNLQQIGLQAAQNSYSRIAQLSLFDFLR